MDDKERRKLIDALSKSHECDHIIKHESVALLLGEFIPRKIFWLPCLIPPLSYSEVRECLVDFMKMTAIALDSIHGCKIAHLDVRVPNVCFKIKGPQLIAVFIDLDRCQPTSSTRKPPYTGDMYMTYQMDGLLRCSIGNS